MGKSIYFPKLIRRYLLLGFNKVEQTNADKKKEQDFGSTLIFIKAFLHEERISSNYLMLIKLKDVFLKFNDNRTILLVNSAFGYPRLDFYLDRLPEFSSYK